MELGAGLGIGFQGTPVTPDYNPLLQESIRLGHERRAAAAKANEDDFKFQKDILDNLNPEGIYSGHIGDVQNVHNDFINGVLSLKKELGSGYSNDPRALQLGLTARQRAKDIKESSKNIAAIKEGEVLNQGLFENQEQAEKYKTAIRTGAYNRQMGEDVFHFKDGYVPQGMYMKARNPVEELQKIFTPLGLNESVTGMKNQNNGFEKVQVSKATPYDQGMRLANDEWTAHETEYKGNGISKEQYLQNAKDALKGITVENLREVPGFGKHSGSGGSKEKENILEQVARVRSTPAFRKQSLAQFRTLNDNPDNATAYSNSHRENTGAGELFNGEAPYVTTGPAKLYGTPEGSPFTTQKQDYTATGTSAKYNGWVSVPIPEDVANKSDKISAEDLKINPSGNGVEFSNLKGQKGIAKDQQLFGAELKKQYVTVGHLVNGKAVPLTPEQAKLYQDKDLVDVLVDEYFVPPTYKKQEIDKNGINSFTPANNPYTGKTYKFSELTKSEATVHSHKMYDKKSINQE